MADIMDMSGKPFSPTNEVADSKKIERVEIQASVAHFESNLLRLEVEIGACDRMLSATFPQGRNIMNGTYYDNARKYIKRLEDEAETTRRSIANFKDIHYDISRD